jgi:outer membrane biosynthesis protein TonB
MKSILPTTTHFHPIFPTVQRSNLQALFSKLQARYPTASLVSELLRVHSSRYVVRASVEVSGIPLATGMATDAELELAEDQAMLRALALVGIQTESALPTPLPAISPLTPSTVASSGGEMAEVQSIATPLKTFSSDNHLSTFLPEVTPVTEAPQPELVTFPSLPEIEVEEIQEPDQELVIAETPEPDPVLPTETPQPSPKPRSKSRTQSVPKTETQPIEEIAEPALSVTEPVDFSDPIAQIDTEMMRVGWTKEQGRDYLKNTYKKRSRQQLSDDELLDFLSYLQSLPSAVQTPF